MRTTFHLRIWFGAAVCLALAAPVAWSAPATGITVAGQTAADDSATEAGPLATLSAKADAEVMQDEMHVTLAAEVTGATQEEVAQALNASLKATLDQAKGHEGIDVQSGAYRIWAMNDRDGRLSEWRGRAEVLLRSRNFPAASQLAATLGAHMPVAGLTFSVSDERRAAEEQKLLSRAAAAFRARAQALARAMGFARYELKTIELGDSGFAPRPMAARMMSAAAADGAALPAEAGRESVSVSVRGTVVLLPTRTGLGR